ncbi:MAG: 4-phosphoerythronate dehydrogenase [Pseudomonadales bacterium]|nr:4-phosphoerythronate dehydrogenase [Pseudomonadales bacterium]
MKIVADENIPGLDMFRRHADVHMLPGREIGRQHLQDADALITRSVTQVSGRLLEGTPVKFVGSCTIGLDHIDIESLQALKIYWVNAPGSNANSVAEYVLACMLALDLPIETIKVGIVGYGNVGSRLYDLLNTLGIDCVCHDPLLAIECVRNPVSFAEILDCDVISLHTPLTEQCEFPTKYLFGEMEFQCLKQGAVLINTARGAVVDNSALFEFYMNKNQGELVTVLDVWENEPFIHVDLLQNVSIATPHIAGYSVNGKMAATKAVYAAFCRYFSLTPVSCSFTDDITLLPETTRSFQEAILSVYNPARDDRLLRQSLLESQKKLTKQERGRKFDALRKHYWQRKEFSNYSVSAISSESLKARLLSLGFSE